MDHFMYSRTDYMDSCDHIGTANESSRFEPHILFQFGDLLRSDPWRSPALPRHRLCPHADSVEADKG